MITKLMIAYFKQILLTVTISSLIGGLSSCDDKCTWQELDRDTATKTSGTETTIASNTKDLAQNNNDTPFNQSSVHRVELMLAIGHFHGNNFHYIEGPQILEYKNLSYEQRLTATWLDTEERWQISGEVDKFLIASGELYSGANFPAPSYGLWVKCYNKAGELINDQLSSESGENRFFFRPTQVKRFSTGQELNLASTDVFAYKYCRADKQHLDLIGSQGFLYTDKNDLAFTYNIELWSLPKGQNSATNLDQFEASSELKKAGKCLLRLPVPVYSWLPKSRTDATLIPEEADEDDEETDSSNGPKIAYLTDFPKDFSAEERATVEALLRLFKIDFRRLQQELYILFNADADESGGIHLIPLKK